jgi:predicted DNA-binding transcriptional regulator AlpA
MPSTDLPSALRLRAVPAAPTDTASVTDISVRKPPQSATTYSALAGDPLLTVDDVARRLRVSKDWVWDHSSRKTPRLPVIQMGDGALRYRSSAIEDFITERERLSTLRFRRR